MKVCYKDDIKIIVQGGNTSLVGGCISEQNEIILSTEKMKKFDI